jgi:hypothetical protein
MNEIQKERLQLQLKSFQQIWKGGYFEGSVLSELSFSTYGVSGYMSVLYATYLKCIKPYIKDDTVVLEIGPGRGAWTKAMLPAKKIVALDALSAEHNGFWNFIGKESHVEYIQVSDFSCSQLPENFFNYMFSFGCLCHISFDGITEYAKNIFPKLKSGCNCFWMIADYDKVNSSRLREEELDIFKHLFRLKKKYLPFYYAYKLLRKKKRMFNKNESDTPSPGRWYHAGTNRCCSMLENMGYRIIEKDVETIHRDPIIHFTKD